MLYIINKNYIKRAILNLQGCKNSIFNTESNLLSMIYLDTIPYYQLNINELSFNIPK